MLLKGSYKDYYFVQTSEEGHDFVNFVNDFSSFLIGKALSVLSFDGDSLLPTKREYKRGWTYDEQEEVAYFGSLSKNELGENIFANCYDEWYLFENITPLISNEIFVTYSGFKLINLSKSELMENLQAKFWKQIENNNPSSFILYGDNFIYGSKNENEINKIIEKWYK